MTPEQLAGASHHHRVTATADIVGLTIADFFPGRSCICNRFWKAFRLISPQAAGR
jgi:hypothetical protein